MRTFQNFAALMICLTIGCGVAPGGRAEVLTGSYLQFDGRHPFVFTTRSRLEAFLRLNTRSARDARNSLEQRAKAALSNRDKLLETFNGCTLNEYVSRLTYEHS